MAINEKYAELKRNITSSYNKIDIPTPFYFLAPFLILFTVFFAYPLLWAVYLSFHTYHSQTGSTFVGVDHYLSILTGGIFWKSLYITLYIAVITVPLQVVGGLIIAVLLNSTYAKIKKTAQTAYLMPMVTSTTVIAMIFGILLEQGGVINTLLDSLAGVTYPWLVKATWARFSVGFAQAWKWTGFFVVIYLAGLQNIPQDLYRAAQIDGANKLQQWWHITVPQLRPIIILVLMIATTRTIRIFDMPFVLTGGGPGTETRTLVILIYQQAFENLNLGAASATAVIFALMLGSLLYLQHEYGEAAQ